MTGAVPFFGGGTHSQKGAAPKDGTAPVYMGMDPSMIVRNVRATVISISVRS